MQVLVADDRITSRVMIETALRERGHTVRNCEDGFEAARLLSNSYAPRIAVISNSLSRLRGLDVCRFLCATGKKSGVYVILVSDVVDMELLELCRRAGVDDVVPRSIPVAVLHARLDVADRVVAMEEELRRVRDVIHGLAAYESPLERKAKVLREANATLLNTAKKKEQGEEKPAEAAAEEVEEQVRTLQRPKPSATGQEKGFRGVNFFSDKDAAGKTKLQQESQESRSLLSDSPPVRKSWALDADVPSVSEKKLFEEERPKARPSVEWQHSDVFGDFSGQESGSSEADQPPLEEHQQVLEGAAQIQDEELADDELIHPFEFDEIVLKVFSGMGVTLKTELPPKAIPSGPWFAAWVGIAMASEETVWLDVVLQAGETAAKAVTAELLGQHGKVDDSDVCEMFAELQNMVQGSLRRYLEENGHKGLLQLAIPKASRREDSSALPAHLAPIVESGFSFNGDPINVMLFEHRDSLTLDDTGNLNLYDLVCDPVLKEGSEDPLLIAGVVFKDKEKAQLNGSGGSVKPFRVLHASPLAVHVGPEKLFV